MQFDAVERAIFIARHGSHAYGLNTPSSDIDIKGFCVPPVEYYAGFLHHFEQEERLVSKGHPTDQVIFAVEKFCRLAADCNPNIIEVLHTDDSDVIKCDEWGQLLRDHRDEFISKRARYTFAGYAHAQLKRIELHRRWLLNPPTSPPTRAEMNLPERTIIPADQLAAAHSAVEKKLSTWNLDDMSTLDPAARIQIINTMAEMLAEIQITADDRWAAAARSVGFADNFIELLDIERRYNSKKKEWSQYQEWKKNRNPARAEQERKWGFDLKHASHLLRLMRMCKEILEGKGVIVKRIHDREELISLKLHGTMKYEDLLAESKQLEADCDALYQTSSLQKSPDVVKLDSMCRLIILGYNELAI